MSTKQLAELRKGHPPRSPRRHRTNKLYWSVAAADALAARAAAGREAYARALAGTGAATSVT